MTDTIRVIISFLNEYYYAHRKFLLLAVLCAAFLLFADKRIRDRFILPLALIVFVVVNPILYEKIFSLIVYRRLFWLFSDVILVALAAVWLIRKMRDARIRYLLFGLSCLLVVVLGTYQYGQTDRFTKTVNAAKLPRGVTEVCDYILSQEEEPRCIMADWISNYVRQYSADIRLLYGRNARGYISNISSQAKKIYEAFKDEEFGKVLDYANKNDYYFVVTEDDVKIDASLLEEYGFTEVFACGPYTVYKSRYDGWEMTEYEDWSGDMGLFYSFYDRKRDRLILIDGGNPDNAQQVKEVIKACSNDVDVWIITHYHPDHVGAFLELCEDPDIRIRQIYDVEMNHDHYLEVAQDWDYPEYYLSYLQKTENLETVSHLHGGDELDLYGLNMQVLSAADEEILQLSKDYPNDASLFFRIAGKEDSILFCADVRSKALGEMLKEKYGNQLQSEYLQVGHHGWNSFDEEFYDLAAPETAFFDTPAWEIESVDNVRLLRKQLRNKGIGIYDFTTAPNRFVFK